MIVATPHYLLFSESNEAEEPGRWRFVLREADGSDRLVADDVEPDTRGERLELLAVVRGLEALDRPCRVTLMTPSTYVREGIRYGLPEWRGNGWRWEFFGQMIPVKNGDLWQRIDRALRFHQVECRVWRLDPPHREEPPLPAGGDPEHQPARVFSPPHFGAKRRPRRVAGNRGRSSLQLARLLSAFARLWTGAAFSKLVLLAGTSGPHRSELTDDPQRNLLGTA
ncbi:MAG: RNase H family protein [Planctomycetota bacterium]